MVYDNKNNFLNIFGLATFPGYTQRIYLARFDTSGNFKFLKSYGPAPATNGYTMGEGHLMLGLRNGGFLALGEESAYGAGGDDIFLIKTDSSGNTNSCNTISFTMSTSKYSFSDHSYSFASANANPKISKGVLVSSPSLKDSEVCAPFISGFNWQTPCAGQATIFEDSSYAKPKSWKWNFGDASSSSNTSTTQNPIHIYSKAGTYFVKLISSNGTQTDSVSKIITISASPTTLKTKTYSICLGDSIQLSASGTGGKTFSWNQGSFLTDSTDSTVYAYPYQPTTFISKVTNSFGCSVVDSFIITNSSSSSCSTNTTIGGVINHYAAVLSYDTCQNTLTVDTSSFFTKGSLALLIESQGATINGSQTSKFGTITSYGNTGNFEYVTVDSISGKTIFIKNVVLRKYDAKGGLQLVTVPQYAGNVIINKTLTAQPWNGVKGGVLIFQTPGNVITNANIDVSGKGFRGGGLVNSSHVCEYDTSWYVSSTTTDIGGKKGEGIAAIISGRDAAKAAQANGGGGGGEHNGGGAGGGNAGAGGVGGNTWNDVNCTIPNTAQGGYSLTNGKTVDKLFFGGGGGVQVMKTKVLVLQGRMAAVL